MAELRATAEAAALAGLLKLFLCPSPSAVGDELEPMGAVEIEDRRSRLFD